MPAAGAAAAAPRGAGEEVEDRARPPLPEAGAGPAAAPAMTRNLRHFRLFLAVAGLGSATAAAARCGVSQPAVTQALARLARAAGGALVAPGRPGLQLSDRGALLAPRLQGAMARLDAALAAVAPRLVLTATSSRLRALAAAVEAENVTLAARALGLAQPTVHRAIAELERDAGRPLFERTPRGMIATRPCRELARAARLAFAEFDQAEADLAAFDGREVGCIVVGALPLARSVLLPEALARFRALRPKQCVTIVDGPYDAMLAGLRHGDIDVIIGALRTPPPVDDITQEPLLVDRLAILARPGHPLAGAGAVPPAVLARQGWAVPRRGTPAREQFDALFAGLGLQGPDSIVECGSILLMRELLARTDLLGCISGGQAGAEVANGLLVRLATGIDWPGRTIGLTCRAGWLPTRAQALLLEALRAAACPPPGG